MVNGDTLYKTIYPNTSSNKKIVFDVDYSNKPLSFEQFSTYTYQLALGITSIHKEGYGHCDLHNKNIMIDTDTNQLKIIDFGLAQPINKKNKKLDWEYFSSNVYSMGLETKGFLTMKLSLIILTCYFLQTKD